MPITPNFLLSQSHLDQFISGEQEKNSIINTPFSSLAEAKGSSWVHDLKGFFLSFVSYLLYAVCLSDFSNKVWVDSRHARHDATAIKADQVFQKHLLCRSINSHRVDSKDYFLLPSCKTTLPTYPTPGRLDFFRADGVCRGMSHWFVHLFFKTKSAFVNSDHHLQAVGKQFELGAPKQAAFLQSLQMPPITLPGMNVKIDYAKISVSGKREEEIVREFQQLPSGAYGIYTSTHQIVYIKVDQLKQYLFDPNVGVLKVTSPIVFKKAIHSCLGTHNHAHDVHVDLYSPA